MFSDQKEEKKNLIDFKHGVRVGANATRARDDRHKHIHRNSISLEIEWIDLSSVPIILDARMKGNEDKYSRIHLHLVKIDKKKERKYFFSFHLVLYFTQVINIDNKSGNEEKQNNE